MSIGGNGYGNSGVQSPSVDAGGYCNQQDIENRVGAKILTQLTNDVTNAGEPNVAVVNSLIEEADALIDAKLGGFYTVPFTTVPTIIKNLSATIAIYTAFQRRPVGLEMPKTWQKAYDDAMKMLDSIVSGVTYLPVTATVATSAGEMNGDRGIEIDFNDTDSNLSDY